jgi:hypothetical protein
MPLVDAFPGTVLEVAPGVDDRVAVAPRPAPGRICSLAAKVGSTGGPMANATSPLSRREFARTTALASARRRAGLAARRRPRSRSAYSITYLGVWYRGGVSILE